MTTTAIKSALGITVRFLNQPVIKENIKNIAGVAAFTFGIIEAHDIYQILRGREICTKTHSDAPKWVQTVSKVALVCAKISLILSASTSRPGVFLISTLMGSCFQSGQLERVFGPNTIFAINPWHPRHVFSVAAVILASPALIQSTCQGAGWLYTTICQNKSTQKENIEGERTWLTDSKVRMMTLFNTITSRPVQHLGNHLCRAIIAV